MSEFLAGAPAVRPGQRHAVIRRCLRCGGEHLRPVETAGSTKLFCTGCHRCWQFEAGYLVEVNPYACSGCAYRSLCRER